MTMQERVDAAMASIEKGCYAYQILGWSFRKWSAGDGWKVGIRAHHSGWFQAMWVALDLPTESEADAAIAYAKGRLA